jgi:hypothetical protein
MRKIKEVLRLKWANGLSDRKIARSLPGGVISPVLSNLYLNEVDRCNRSLFVDEMGVVEVAEKTRQKLMLA